MPDIYDADSMDLRILEALRKDVRANIRLLAKECGISSTAVHSRIRKLKSSGIIIGTYLLVGHSTFDYQYQASVEILAETQHMENVLKKIRADPNVVVCTKGVGKYNLLCLVIGRNNDELNKDTQKIRNIPGVIGCATNLWVQEAIITGISEKTLSSQQKPDDLDTKILEELLKDCQVPCTVIASKLGVSIETVRKRIAKMRANNIIRACSVTIDWSKLGYQGTAFFFILIKQGFKNDAVLNELKRIEAPLVYGKVTGSYDILAIFGIKGVRDLTRLADWIQKMPSVAHIDVSIANFTYFSFAPIPRNPFKCDTLELS